MPRFSSPKPSIISSRGLLIRWVRTLARHLRPNPTFVQRVWTAHGLQPHLVRAFTLSQDPHFQDKLEDVKIWIVPSQAYP